jgi:hypothetical protein
VRRLYWYRYVDNVQEKGGQCKLRIFVLLPEYPYFILCSVPSLDRICFFQNFDNFRVQVDKSSLTSTGTDTDSLSGRDDLPLDTLKDISGTGTI